MTDKVIECKDVWKLFGGRTQAALAAMQCGGLSKAEVLRSYGCVVGVAEVNLAIVRGEIFCIMGLSGSGKSTLVRHINGLIDPTAARSSSTAKTSAPRAQSICAACVARRSAWCSRISLCCPTAQCVENVAFGLEDSQACRRSERLAIARRCSCI